MLKTRSLQIAVRIAVFCAMSFIALGLMADILLAGFGLSTVLLPDVFRSKTLLTSSRDDLGRGREEGALNKARAAVLKEPLSAEALAVLALSSTSLKPYMSSNALVQAAGLGWRNILVQASVIESAASAKNWNAVGPRLLAVASLDKLDAINPAVFEINDAADYSAKIAPAFLDSGLAWFKVAQWMRSKGLESESKYFLAQTPAYNDVDACVWLKNTANEFIRDGDIAFAAGLIASRCGSFLTSASDSISFDQHFGDPGRGPFEWQMVGQAGVSFRTEMRSGKTILEIQNADPLPRIIASKILRTNELRLGEHTYAGELRINDSSGRVVPLFFESIGKRRRFWRTSSSTLNRSPDDNGGFIRVYFKLPTGRFQLSVKHQ